MREASPVQLASIPWCLRFKRIFKIFCRGATRKSKKSSIPGRRSSSKLLRMSITESCASFAQRHQLQQKKMIGADYKKLKPQQNLSTTSSSSSSATSFSFHNRGNETPKASYRLDEHRHLQQQQRAKLEAPSLKLGEKWREVVEMVTVEGSFDDLVDLEEFLGYYLLIRDSPVFAALIHSFFNEFCSEFCEEESQVISLFIPELQDFPSFASSEREYECLPPSPCSKQQSFNRLT